MNSSLVLKVAASLAAGTFAMLAIMQSAGAADRVRISGTIESLNGDTLMVKSLDGKEIMVMMKPGLNVMGIKNASVADIKPGDFVGVGSQPTQSGINGAVQVVIFPASMKGTGEGDRAWSVRPNGSMTNATVADAVKDVNGPVLTLAYQGGQRKISIPDGTTIVALSPATRDDLKAGAGVSVQGQGGDDNMVTADAVRVGIAGATPPK
ncbi:hypothetical protein [Neorhizobium alkalisoli]|uniref:DUF5666 domain-containing protein n=1 Tax=Neorhizobium alkalisoli TaxID=528178 RepID=A0A561QIZ9_9HYPH|nr:hypothetical protein [Neorhizobium alkalisoli]TWF50322.1 hypothetical protein FHW37_106285 [Neorhizobium alkalisoli]